MKWAMTNHAALRAAERKISRTEIEELVHYADFVIPQGPKYLFVKTFPHRIDNHIAAVIIRNKELDLWVVITLLVNFQIRNP